MTHTIAAISTPRGAGAVGIVRLSGPNAREIAAQVFHPIAKGKSLAAMGGYTGCLGRVRDSRGELDETVAYVYAAPRSYTGEDVVELCCHGSSLLLERTLAACVEAGARLAAPGEFTRRAFLNGKLSLDEAEAVMNLISAQSDSAARAAMAARDGNLWKEITACSNALLDLAAHLTAWVDYPEEGVEELHPQAMGETLGRVGARLKALKDNYKQGRILREGVDTVIAGRPNVGKSTLMNLLSGRERSIVTDIPGTTRDVVEDSVRLGDLVLRLSDTAGLRVTDDVVEQAGVRRAEARLEQCDLVLAIFDSSRPLSDDDLALIERLRGRLAIAIINKTDLPRRLDTACIKAGMPHVIEMTAKTGRGVKELSGLVARLLCTAQLDPSAPILATHRQLDCVSRALNALNEAEETLEGGLTLDALSVCVDEAIDALLELTGERATAAVVDRVFENFCVGK